MLVILGDCGKRTVERLENVGNASEKTKEAWRKPEDGLGPGEKGKGPGQPGLTPVVLLTDITQGGRTKKG